MNKKLFFSFVLLLSSVLFFSACNDDDDDAKKPSFAGTYSGKLSVSLLGGAPTEYDQDIILSGDGGHYLLKLENFNFTDEISVPLITIPASITDEGKVSGSVKDAELNIDFGEGTAAAITAESITLSGNVANQKADLAIGVLAPLTPGADPIKMDITFKGDKQ